MASRKLVREFNPAILVVVVVVLLVAALLLILPGGGKRTITADFPRTVSLYKGSDVKILGVSVGKVDDVTPMGTKVRVKFTYDDKYKVPADAKAVVISPSIVGDRFIQLTPVYRGGAVLKNDAHLGTDRTATPLELDEIFGSINDLTKALGPEGANKPDATGTGALTRLLDSTAKNFGGQGVQFNSTLKNLSRLTKTLADNKDELFGTVSEIEKFTSALSANDETVRKFNDSLASGAQLLSDERGDLAQVLQNLSVALTQVRSFVADNKQALTTNIKGLNQISKIFAKNRAALEESLKDAPQALNNLALAYDENAGTLDTRANIGESVTQLTAKPSVVLCALLPDACGPLKTVLGVLGLGRTAPLQSSRVTVVEPIDRSLGGLVEVNR
ncbi:MCE family protein [Nocardioides marmorisolisilvae]|uniref:MCE family protein n=1 Tax=Nocardioides marmorisolisilvae TaxID=1542737 RepID=A0A3N0DZX4_9ACTN|nr:MCE family protein [Nocardioides marmorisolisilvae]RNL81053.1 MCE family protein [Nocardioides marmorisolisilvae]